MPVGAPLPNFLPFGMLGELYASLFHQARHHSRDLWRDCEYFDGREFDEVIRAEAGLESVWAVTVRQAVQADMLLPSYADKILDGMSEVVNAGLPKSARVDLARFPVDERIQGIHYLIYRPRQLSSKNPDNQFVAPAESGSAIVDGNTICFGPFCERELEFVVQHHPRIFEVGAGTFYAGSVLEELGVDIIAVDNGHYESSVAIFPWQTESQRKQLKLGNYDALLEKESEGRTLLMSWPEPQAPYPARVLRNYREAGGKSFLFKLGGYFSGQYTQVHGRPPEYQPSAKWELWDELIENWQLDPRLPFEPWLIHNSLLAFELRS